MSERTLRDTFAAAALTGLLRKLRPGSVFDLTITARQAFEIADAMLRERARNGAPVGRETVTDHDAASAAKAAELARSPGQSPRGTGHTQPTLTDAEREALERPCEAVVEYAADDRKTNGETFAAGDEQAVTVVRPLLARHGGGE